MTYNNELEIGSERIIIPEIRENSLFISDYYVDVLGYCPFLIDKVSQNLLADLENADETNTEYYRNIKRELKLEKRVNKYHPKLLKTFTKEELDSIMDCGILGNWRMDDDGYIDKISLSSGIMAVEIFTDCEATDKEHALMHDYYGVDIFSSFKHIHCDKKNANSLDVDTSEDGYLSKELFSILYEISKP